MSFRRSCFPVYQPTPQCRYPLVACCVGSIKLPTIRLPVAAAPLIEMPAAVLNPIVLPALVAVPPIVAAYDRWLQQS